MAINGYAETLRATDQDATGPPEPKDPSPVPEEPPCDLQRRRREALQAHLVASLEQKHPSRVVLGVTSNDLLNLAMQWKLAIDEGMADQQSPLQAIERLGPAIEQYLKITRQIDRFSNLHRLLAEESPGT